MRLTNRMKFEDDEPRRIPWGGIAVVAWWVLAWTAVMQWPGDDSPWSIPAFLILALGPLLAIVAVQRDRALRRELDSLKREGQPK